jgi:putative ABC transport system permease protein
VILMRPKPGIRVDTAMQEVWELMMLRSQNRPVYRVDSRESVLNILGNIIRVAGIVLGGVAALSLLVGGIGVMNIMLVSVTERTREIGLRKAVGARRFHILVQFLVEAGVLCLAGGLIGMGLGWVLGHLVSWATRAADLLGGTGLVVAFPLWAALLAVAFSALVGMVFGIYPAYSAARLHPIEALRFE